MGSGWNECRSGRQGETHDRAQVDVAGEGEGGVTSHTSHLFQPCSRVQGCRKRSRREEELAAESLRAWWLSRVLLSKAYV